METFNEFVDKKVHEEKRQLKIVSKALQQGGFGVKEHIDEDEPYVFILNNVAKLSFDGVRLYGIGGSLAYRVQKEERTHPYGKAYPLDLEEYYNDMISDNKKTEEAAKEIIKGVNEELKNFFVKSAKAEEEIQDRQVQKSDPLGKVVIKSTGTDYSNTLHSTGTNYGG